MTLAKLRQVCTLSVLPRFLRGDQRCSSDPIEKLSVRVQRVYKSTDSGNNDEEEYVKCQRILDRTSPNRNHGNVESMANTPKIVATSSVDKCERCQRIINDIFGEDNLATNRDVVTTDVATTELHATTAKEPGEELTQKLEDIDETPLVEAQVETKVKDFIPEVLGNMEHRNAYNTFNNCSRMYCNDDRLDEVATRCLNSPSSDIDERLLKEMEKLGVPPTNKSSRTEKDSRFDQPKIMRILNSPAEKPDEDNVTKGSINNSDIFDSDLSHPFELIPVKADTVNLSSIEIEDNEDNSIISERVLPHNLNAHVSDKIKSEHDEIENLARSQQLLGHLTAAVLSNGTIIDKSNVERLVIGQETDFEKELNIVQDSERISILKLKELEEQDRNMLEDFQMEHFKPETVNLHRYKEDMNTVSKEIEPGIVIRDCTYQKPVEAAPIVFKSHSEKSELITAHQFFEELSIISRETELGVITDDVCEMDKNGSENLIERHNDTFRKSNRSQLLEDAENSKDIEPFMYPQCQRRCNYESKIDFNSDENTVNSSQNKSLLYELVSRTNLEQTPLSMASEMCRNPSIQAELLTKYEHLFRRSPALPDLRPPPEFQEKPVDPELKAEMDQSINTILCPLIDKGGTKDGHLNPDMSPISPGSLIPSDVDPTPKDVPLNELPLSEMLKRIRQRNRIHDFKQAIAEAGMSADIEPVGKCGDKKPPCPPPAPTCPPPAPVCPPQVPQSCPNTGPLCPCPPPPPDPPCPKPCKPKCKPPCSPCNPCDPKPKCPPAKKNPCDFQAKCSIDDVLTLLIYCLGIQLHIPQRLLSALACMVNHIPVISKSKTEPRKIKSAESSSCHLKTSSLQIGDTCKNLAKTYDPWTPIPSWPIPVREKKKKLVCPKDGCKVDPPKLNCPNRDVNPCINFPKKHFSVVQFITATITAALGQRNFACDLGD